MSAVKEVVKSLRKRIVAILDLKDSDRIDKFFDREVSKAKSAIGKLKSQKTVKEVMHKANLDAIEDRLADKQDDVVLAQEDVVLDQIRSNAEMDNFASYYWGKIKAASKDVASIEEEVAEATEAYKLEIEKIDEQIEAYKERIAICIS